MPPSRRSIINIEPQKRSGQVEIFILIRPSYEGNTINIYDPEGTVNSFDTASFPLPTKRNSCNSCFYEAES